MGSCATRVECSGLGEGEQSGYAACVQGLTDRAAVLSAIFADSAGAAVVPPSLDRFVVLDAVASGLLRRRQNRVRRGRGPVIRRLSTIRRGAGSPLLLPRWRPTEAEAAVVDPLRRQTRSHSDSCRER